MVPSASGWPSWPIMTTSRPWSRIFETSTWTLVTSGQVASKTLRPRASASRRTSSATPWAEKITVAPARHLVQLLDEHRALGAQVVDHELVVHDLVAHVDRRAVQLERALDDRDGAVDAGAEAARLGEQDLGRSDGRGSLMASPGLRADDARGAAGREAVPDEQRHADGDGRVGDVEGGEVVAGGVQLDEVDDVAQRHAVVEVAERAAQHERERRATAGARCRACAASTTMHGRDRDGDDGEEPALPAAGAGEEAERGAGVVHQHQVEEGQSPRATSP